MSRPVLNSRISTTIDWGFSNCFGSVPFCVPYINKVVGGLKSLCLTVNQYKDDRITSAYISILCYKREGDCRSYFVLFVENNRVHVYNH